MHTFDEIIRFATANLTALAAQMATAPRPTSDSEDDPLINARALVSLSWNYGAAAYKIQVGFLIAFHIVFIPRDPL